MPKNETTETFAERLADLIADKNISLEKIGKEIGISKSTLSKYTNDEAEAPIGNLVKLANYFNVSADYLLGISEAKTNDKDLQFVCDYTGLSVNAVNKLRGNSHQLTIQTELCPNDEIFTNSPSKTLDLFDKCKSDFISSDDFCNILICILFDKLLIENLKELKQKVENNEFSEEFEKVRLYSRVANWNNEHRLNLFNAQDSLISFMKEYNDFDDMDINYYRELIKTISNVFPSYSNDESEYMSAQDMIEVEQLLNDETIVDGD